MLVADLIILANVPKRYTYSVPDSLTLSVGHFVNVTFARKKQIGLCISLTNANKSDYPYPLSEIESLDEKRAIVPNSLLQLINWFSPFYCVSDYHSFQCIVGQKKVRKDEFSVTKILNTLNPLSIQQETVFNNILESFNKPHLIHGVTGSGKTQVYAHLIQHVITLNQKALVLIPEISLTPQFTAFFSDVFDRVAVVHSGLTPKKKEIIWNQCLRGELDIIVGPRSAIFMPFQDIGLIIIDEEHDSSYKQENSPRYYTHDIAFERARIHNACLVFGSATPSLDLFYLAQKKQLSYHVLKERFNNCQMPQVTVLDMATTQQNLLIHDKLLKKIELNLRNKQRTLLLVNRRGYSSFLRCSACGQIQECASCQTSYTYHSDGYFRCHRCMSVKPMSRQCMSCGSYDVEYHGIAIQKIEMELRRLFPTIKLTRVDRDTVKNFNDLESALDEVNQSDILIGTQMISKGHNFKNVSLVGIIGVDTLLNFPDYRSSERLFQLITQMAGRAGRDLDSSEVYVQTFKPDHYVFHFSKTHDVDGFLQKEINFRKPFNYPPYSAVVNIIFSSQDNKKAIGFYEAIKSFNENVLKTITTIQIIGPKVAPIEKVSGYFRHNLFYKVPHPELNLLKDLLNTFPKKRDVRLVIDIAPQSLL